MAVKVQNLGETVSAAYMRWYRVGKSTRRSATAQGQRGQKRFTRGILIPAVVGEFVQKWLQGSSFPADGPGRRYRVGTTTYDTGTAGAQQGLQGRGITVGQSAWLCDARGGRCGRLKSGTG